MNISYNQFSGLVSRDMAKMDVLNLTMLNDKGVAQTLKISADKNTALASED